MTATEFRVLGMENGFITMASTDQRDERRGAPRRATDFYAVETRGGARVFRLIRNVSAHGLLFENRLADEVPGQLVELELPSAHDPAAPRCVRGEVVYVTPAGHVGVRLLEPTDPEVLGGAARL